MSSAKHSNKEGSSNSSNSSDSLNKWQNLKKLLHLAGPITAAVVLQQATLVSNVIFLGHIPLDADSPYSLATYMAGATLGRMMCNITGFSLAFGMTSALDTLLSQAYGAKKYSLVGLHTQRSIVILSILSFLVAWMWTKTEFVLVNLLEIDDSIARLSGEWAYVSLIGLWPTVMYAIATKFIQNQNIVWPVTVCNVLGTTINIAVNYLLVIRLRWGFIGCAYTLVIQQWAQLVAIVLLIVARKRYVAQLRRGGSGFIDSTLVYQALPTSSSGDVRDTADAADATDNKHSNNVISEEVDDTEVVYMEGKTGHTFSCSDSGAAAGGDVEMTCVPVVAVTMANTVRNPLSWEYNKNNSSHSHSHSQSLSKSRQPTVSGLTSVSMDDIESGNSSCNKSHDNSSCGNSGSVEALVKDEQDEQDDQDEIDPEDNWPRIVFTTSTSTANSSFTETTKGSLQQHQQWEQRQRHQGCTLDRPDSPDCNAAADDMYDASPQQFTSATTLFSSPQFSSSSSLHEIPVGVLFEHWDVFFSLGCPAAISLFIEWGSYELSAGIAGQLPNSATALAVHSIFSSIAGLTYQVPQAVAFSTAILTGQELGAGRPDHAQLFVSLGVAVDCCYGLMLGLTILLFPVVRQSISEAFTLDPSVRDMTEACLPIMALYILVDATKCITLISLRSIGRPQLTVIGNTIACVGVLLPIGYYTSVIRDGGLVALWGSMSLAWATATAMYCYILYTTDWTLEARAAADRNRRSLESKRSSKSSQSLSDFSDIDINN